MAEESLTAVILPAQFFTRRSPESPERALMAAVLEDALRCLAGGTGKARALLAAVDFPRRRRRPLQLRRSVRRYLTSL